MVITYNRYRLIFSWPIEYKVTVKILKVAVNNSYLKVTVKHISNTYKKTTLKKKVTKNLLQIN